VPIERDDWPDDVIFQKEIRDIVTDMVQEAVNVPDIQFSLASDAHQLDRVGNIQFPLELLQELDISEERIMRLQKKK
jgi:histidinol phosphatase-like PHP family hydrolase